MPHLIIARCTTELNKNLLDKIALMCGINKNELFQSKNIKNKYLLPSIFIDQKLDEKILDKLSVKYFKTDFSSWIDLKDYLL